MNFKFTIIIVVASALIVLATLPFIHANLSTMITTFEKPNAQLEDNKIPEEVGHLNKNYQHEEFAELMKQEIEKAEIIRDRLIISTIQEK